MRCRVNRTVAVNAPKNADPHMPTEKLLLAIYSLLSCLAPLPANPALWIILYRKGRGMTRARRSPAIASMR